MVHLFTLTLLCAYLLGCSFGTPLPKCKKPAVRKEWRALGHDGQKAFADAIKVSACHLLIVTLSSTESVRYSVCRSFHMNP